MRTSQASSDLDGFGEVKLQVAATEAWALEKALIEPARKLGGELVSSVRDGEDLSENIVDTEARLQSRLVLRGKLTDILRTNKGSVDELINAEKAVADVNEEIDASTSKLQGYRTRVRYSDVRIECQPQFGETQFGFARSVMTAVRSIGTTLGTTIAVLIYMITTLIPSRSSSLRCARCSIISAYASVFGAKAPNMRRMWPELELLQVVHGDCKRCAHCRRADGRF